MRTCQNGGKKMKKMVSILLACFVLLFPMQSYASGWQGNAEKGWWYSTNEENSTWYQDGWHWIDGNHDGIAECYYFTNNGYLVVKGETPDGFLVNDYGAWIVNNSVQTKMVGTGEMEQHRIRNKCKKTPKRIQVKKALQRTLRSTVI